MIVTSVKFKPINKIAPEKGNRNSYKSKLSELNKGLTVHIIKAHCTAAEIQRSTLPPPLIQLCTLFNVKGGGVRGREEG